MPQLTQIIPNNFLLISIGQKVLKIISLIIGGLIAKKVIALAISRWQDRQEKPHGRGKTLANLLQNTVNILINAVLLLLILSELGFNIIPLLTGAGVVGLAIGMGAKNIASDLIAGFFILFEDRFNVGDKIEINSIQGKVIDLSLRTITIEDKDKNVHIVPNSSIGAIKKFKE